MASCEIVVELTSWAEISRSAYFGLPSTTQESTLRDLRSLRSDLIPLQVLDERLLEVSNGLVVLLDQLGKVVKSPSNTGAVDLLTDFDTVYLQLAHQMHHSLIRSIVLRHLSHQQGSAVDPLLVGVTSEPSLSKEDHFFPMIPDRVANEDGDCVDHGYVSPEDVSAQILNCEQTEVVSRVGRDFLEIVNDVDGSAEHDNELMYGTAVSQDSQKDTADQDGYGQEQHSQKPEASEKGDSVET